MAIKAFRYSCDCGSLAVGSDGCRVLVGNSEGDGDFAVIVAAREDFEAIKGDYIFATACEGTAVTIYDYDCAGGAPLCTMAGRFGIYRRRRGGDMAVVRWE